MEVTSSASIVIASLHALDWATIGLFAVTALLALAALGQLRILATSEGRNQPVAIAHEQGPADLEKFNVFLTNEGVGTAFNVRFGIKLDRIEYPAGDGRGHRHYVPAGARVPHSDTFDVKFPVLGLIGIGHRPGVYERRVFFARYENSYGRTWETINPADQTAGLVIRRRRCVRLHEWRHAGRRSRSDRIVNRRLVEELRGDPLPLKRRIMRRLGR